MKFNELIKKLDKVFSEYVRLKNSNESGYCQCITCGKINHWKDIDCGHYIGRKHIATRFSEMNCAPQCTWCNKYMEGQHFKFRQKLVEKHGINDIAVMEVLADITKTENCQSLECKILEYKEKVKKLKKEKGLCQ